VAASNASDQSTGKTPATSAFRGPHPEPTARQRQVGPRSFPIAQVAGSSRPATTPPCRNRARRMRAADKDTSRQELRYWSEVEPHLWSIGPRDFEFLNGFELLSFAEFAHFIIIPPF
jgi:hypothetical protein